MRNILEQMKRGYAKIDSLSQWNFFYNLPSAWFNRLCALYIDNSNRQFNVDYEFINRIAKLTKYNGLGELNICDPDGLQNFNFLKRIFVDQLYLSSSNLDLEGLTDAGGISVLMFQTGRELYDLTPISRHNELSALDIHCSRMGSIRPLNELKQLSSLGLHGFLSNCSELCYLDCFKESHKTDLLLNENKLEDMDALTYIYAPIISLDSNCISDLHPLETIVNHNLHHTYGFEISVRDNPISPQDRQLVLHTIKNLPESKGKFPKLRFFL